MLFGQAATRRDFAQRQRLTRRAERRQHRDECTTDLTQVPDRGRYFAGS